MSHLVVLAESYFFGF